MLVVGAQTPIRKDRLKSLFFLLTTEVSEDKQRKQRIQYQILISLFPLLNLCFLCG